jgi:hypothetical protein
MTLGDTDMHLISGGVSLDDSATLLSLASAFEMLGTCSSYKKTPVGTIS